jgi:hypothetical protein
MYGWKEGWMEGRKEETVGRNVKEGTLRKERSHES